MSLTRQRQKELVSLHQGKYRTRYAEYLIDGVRAVEAAVLAGAPLREVLVTADAQMQPRVQHVLERVAAMEVVVHEVPASVLQAVSAVETPQGLVAVAQVATVAPEALTGAVLALDAVQDPGNVGTLIRSAAWFGLRGVLLGPGTVDPFNPKVVRATMGGLWEVALAPTADLAGALRSLREAGYACYGADVEGTPAQAWAPPAKTVLVLGSEAHGLSPAVREAVQGCVCIEAAPGRAGTESLNVAIAGSILLHRWHRPATH
ncbi:MAG: RNA methyltransferase [Bacteroidota bacterium]